MVSLFFCFFLLIFSYFFTKELNDRSNIFHVWGLESGTSTSQLLVAFTQFGASVVIKWLNSDSCFVIIGKMQTDPSDIQKVVEKSHNYQIESYEKYRKRQNLTSAPSKKAIQILTKLKDQNKISSSEWKEYLLLVSKTNSQNHSTEQFDSKSIPDQLCDFGLMITSLCEAFEDDLDYLVVQLNSLKEN